MSATTEPKPHPWLTFLLPLLLACGRAAVARRVISSDVRHLEQAQAMHEKSLAEVEANQRQVAVSCPLPRP